MMFAVAIVAVLVSLGMALVRALAGPTVFDRVLAANAVGSLVVLVFTLLGFVVGRPEFLDLAMLYTLLNVIGTIAVLRFFRHGGAGDPETREGAND
ncbi:MAG: monovalent cation/H+ antiporter complex subunit F [Alphaproteobacteria bacterium]